MSCPNLEPVIRARMLGEDPEEWTSIREHLTICDACRESALVLDPLLALGALAPKLTVSVDGEEMKARVRALRRATTVDKAVSRTPRGWRRVVALGPVAALLALGVLLNPYPGPPQVEDPPTVAEVSEGFDSDEEILSLVAGLPVVEVAYGDDGPEQVMEWDGEITVALLVDERFDV